MVMAKRTSLGSCYESEGWLRLQTQLAEEVVRDRVLKDCHTLHDNHQSFKVRDSVPLGLFTTLDNHYF